MGLWMSSALAFRMNCMNRAKRPDRLRLTGEVWREGNMYTAYCRELDLASCGHAVEEAWQNLHQVFEIFLEETSKKGTLQELLEEAGLISQGGTFERPEYFIGQIVELPRYGGQCSTWYSQSPLVIMG